MKSDKYFLSVVGAKSKKIEEEFSSFLDTMKFTQCSFASSKVRKIMKIAESYFSLKSCIVYAEKFENESVFINSSNNLNLKTWYVRNQDLDESSTNHILSLLKHTQFKQMSILFFNDKKITELLQSCSLGTIVFDKGIKVP